jgi:S-DNA-T family DNA segregation ATPase FtsK/SpoIIIE
VDVFDDGRDELFDEAVQIVLESHRGSVSLLQRRLSIGYARASRIIEMMAAVGILGEYKGSQAREVTMTVEEYEKLRNQMEEEEEAEYEEGRRSGGDSSEPTYISEGQLGYLAADNEDD